MKKERLQLLLIIPCLVFCRIIGLGQMKEDKVWKTTDGGQTWRNISDGFFKCIS